MCLLFLLLISIPFAFPRQLNGSRGPLAEPEEKGPMGPKGIPFDCAKIPRGFGDIYEHVPPHDKKY